MFPKGKRVWHDRVLPDPDVRSWFDNLARRNVTTADLYLRRLARTLDAALGIKPGALLAMDQAELENAVSTCIAHELDRGILGSTVLGFERSVKSFLKWHNRKVTRDNVVPGGHHHPRAESEAVPDQELLARVLKGAETRTAAIIAVLAQGGVRPQVLGLIDASRGLRLGDFVEATITPEGIEFEEVPTRVVVSRELSKNGKPFFFFLGPESCEYVQAYLRGRVENGERLSVESPLFSPIGGKPRFMLRNNISDCVRRAMRRSGMAGRPYVWRSYYANRCQLAESKGFLEAWRKFCMGHTGDIQTRYAMRKGALPQDSVEQMREAFKLALPFLETGGQQQDDPTLGMTEMILRAAGTSEEALREMDLQEKSREELLEIVSTAFAGASEPVGSRDAVPSQGIRRAQRIVATQDLQDALNEGWLFKANLGDGSVVVEAAT